MILIVLLLIGALENQTDFFRRPHPSPPPRLLFNSAHCGLHPLRLWLLFALLTPLSLCSVDSSL
jgi:hypothetical protein